MNPLCVLSSDLLAGNYFDNLCNSRCAQELRQVVFGCSVSAPKHEWLRTGLVFRDADQELGYGLKSPRNGTRGLLSVVQGHIIKHLLFEKRDKDQRPRPDM
jgi:hypothetical protein